MPKKQSLSKRLVHLIEYVALLSFAFVLRILPFGIVYSIAGFFGMLACDLFGIRLDVTMENLRRAFGKEMSEKELKALARESYKNIGMTFIEMLLVPRLRHDLLTIVDVSEIKTLDYNAGDGQGIIFVSGHFGSWELSGAAIALSGIAMTAVAKEQSNPYADEYITRQRNSFGIKVVQPGASLKHLVKALRAGEGIGLISDQDAGKNGVFVDFFGEKASTPGGAAQLALKYGSPIVISMTIRLKPGEYKSIYRPVEVLDGDTVESITQRFTTVMESVIREYPSQYFWMHRRWKTRPQVMVDASNGNNTETITEAS